MSASTAGYRAQLLGDAALTAGMADSNTFQNADTLEWIEKWRIEVTLASNFDLLCTNISQVLISACAISVPVYDFQATNQPDAEKEVAGLLSSWFLPARDNHDEVYWKRGALLLSDLTY